MNGFPIPGEPMSDPDLEAQLRRLLAMERQASSDDELAAVQRTYDELLAQRPYCPDTLVQHNQFRLRNLRRLPARPRVLIGGMSWTPERWAR